MEGRTSFSRRLPGTCHCVRTRCKSKSCSCAGACTSSCPCSELGCLWPGEKKKRNSLQEIPSLAFQRFRRFSDPVGTTEDVTPEIKDNEESAHSTSNGVRNSDSDGETSASLTRKSTNNQKEKAQATRTAEQDDRDLVDEKRMEAMQEKDEEAAKEKENTQDPEDEEDEKEEEEAEEEEGGEEEEEKESNRRTAVSRRTVRPRKRHPFVHTRRRKKTKAAAPRRSRRNLKGAEERQKGQNNSEAEDEDKQESNEEEEEEEEEAENEDSGENDGGKQNGNNEEEDDESQEDEDGDEDDDKEDMEEEDNDQHKGKKRKSASKESKKKRKKLRAFYDQYLIADKKGSGSGKHPSWPRVCKTFGLPSQSIPRDDSLIENTLRLHESESNVITKATKKVMAELLREEEWRFYRLGEGYNRMSYVTVFIKHALLLAGKKQFCCIPLGRSSSHKNDDRKGASAGNVLQIIARGFPTEFPVAAVVEEVRRDDFLRGRARLYTALSEASRGNARRMGPEDAPAVWGILTDSLLWYFICWDPSTDTISETPGYYVSSSSDKKGIAAVLQVLIGLVEDQVRNFKPELERLQKEQKRRRKEQKTGKRNSKAKAV